MKRNILLTLIIGIFLIGMVNAYEPHKQNTDLEFSFTSNNATSCNVTTSNTPSGIVVINQLSTRNGQTFNNTITEGNFSVLGNYCFNIVCSDGVENENGQVCKEITSHGNENPSESLKIFFIISFIIAFSFSIIYFFVALNRVTSLEMDLMDTIILMVSYFVVWILFYFSQTYFGDGLVNTFLELFINIGWITHIFLALVGFMVSFIMTNLKFKQKARITY